MWYVHWYTYLFVAERQSTVTLLERCVEGTIWEETPAWSSPSRRRQATPSMVRGTWLAVSGYMTPFRVIRGHSAAEATNNTGAEAARPAVR